MAEYSINIENLTKIYKVYPSFKHRMMEMMHIGNGEYYKEFYALTDVDFNVKPGETVGIIGTNGAGKSTILKVISGVLEPTFGTVQVNGKISALLELGAGFNEEYTGRENIYLNGRMMGYSRQEMDERINDIIDFAEIGRFIDQPVKTYSSGMFARLAFSVAINVDPDILIVDEALSVGDIFFQNRCYEKFAELRKKGVTILFVTHDISTVRRMCSRVLWLEHGHARFFGDTTTGCNMFIEDRRKQQYFDSPQVALVDGQPQFITEVEDHVEFPPLDPVKDSCENDKIKIKTIFFTKDSGEYADVLFVDQKYVAHIVVECLQDVEDLIVGFVMENQKGVELYDFNNYVNRQHKISGKKGKVLDVNFHFDLPRLMNGEYVVNVTAGEAFGEEITPLSSLHAFRKIEVNNQGYNSSYLEVPAKIEVLAYDRENIQFE